MDALRALDRGKDGQEYNATSINAGFLALSLFFSPSLSFLSLSIPNHVEGGASYRVFLLPLHTQC